MSRIGMAPIIVPKGVSLVLEKNNVFVKGPHGELTLSLLDGISLKESSENKWVVERKNDEKKTRSLHGLYRALINNMVSGVFEPFKKQLELVGVGYRASIAEKGRLELSLGYSHNFLIELPKEFKVDVKIERGKNPIISLECFDKQLLGMVTYYIRSLRPPEPYKGKGIREVGELILIKEGKKA